MSFYGSCFAGMGASLAAVCLVSFILLVSLECFAAEPGGSSVINANLGGYGRLGMIMEKHPGGISVSKISCEDDAHADLLLGKLIADMTWDKIAGPVQVDLGGGISGLDFKGSGIMVIAARGSVVYSITAPSVELANGTIKKEGLGDGASRCKPSKALPAWTGFFDLNATRMSIHDFNLCGTVKEYRLGYDRETLAGRYEFWNKFNIGIGANYRTYMGWSNLLDGPVQSFPMEYEMDLAKKAGQSINVWFGPVFPPQWIRNRFPTEMARLDESTIPSWGNAVSMGQPHISLAASEECLAYVHRYNLSMLERCRKAAGDSLASIRVAFGRPGDEDGVHSLSSDLMVHADADQKSFRRWLREKRGLSLPELGKRWHGDEGRYRSWDDVEVPMHAEFFGGYGHETLNLVTDWLCRPDELVKDQSGSKKADAENWGGTDYRPGAEWTKVDLAPSADQKMLDTGAKWFLKEFDAAEWMAAHPKSQYYLVAGTYNNAAAPIEVRINGVRLADVAPKSQYVGPVAMQVTSMLARGRNTICMRVPDGVIKGPVFITATEPKRYPYLGANANARFVDLQDWLADNTVEGWKRVASIIRSREPDIPFLFVPGTSYEIADHFLGLKRDLGISGIHQTGSDASYRPHWPGIAYLNGFNSSSEEAGLQENPERLSAQLGWFLLNADGEHNFIYDAANYEQVDRKTGWFTKNKRLLQLIGKATWVKPEVVLFHSSGSERYFPYSDFSFSWDIGRGSLQAAHFNNVYATEAEINAGLVKDYPVIFDCNNRVVDDKTLASIEEYVRGGGVFVALNATGRHSLLEADSWPISKLTGFKVVGERKNMMVTIQPGNPLLKKLAGMSFPGDGSAINWMGTNHADNGGIALRSDAPENVAIATWEDGSIAVGMRRLGKGKVIVLASTFWRNMSDRAGKGVSLNGPLQTVFLNDLMENLGVRKLVDCSSEDVWCRRLITKNGVQEWLVISNQGRILRSGVDVSCPLDVKPVRIVDMAAGNDIPFKYENGRMSVSGLSIEPNETKVIGIVSKDLGDALPFWLETRKKYETRPNLPPPADVKLPKGTDIVMDKFRFRMSDPARGADLSWLAEDVSGVEWKDMGYGFWNDAGLPVDGTGLYRAEVNIPEEWGGRRLMLSFLSYNWPVFLGESSIYINGNKAAEYKPHGWANNENSDVTGFLKPGINRIGILVRADNARHGRGGYLGQMAFQALEPFEKVIELKDGWSMVKAESAPVPATLPLKEELSFMEAKVNVPSDWKPEDTFIELEGRPLFLIMVNGRPISVHGGWPCWGRTRLCLYPHIRPGQQNIIQVWFHGGGGFGKNVKIELSDARLGLMKRQY
ncbi:MAG: hypothetical protein WAX69_13910 [Victivallales bacterium]